MVAAYESLLRDYQASKARNRRLADLLIRAMPAIELTEKESEAESSFTNEVRAEVGVEL